MSFSVVIVAGIPLAGKTEVLKSLSRMKKTRLFTRSAGHRGFTAREVNCFVRRDEGLLQLRTYAGTVWTPAMWSVALAGADAILVVVDARAFRRADQLDFLEALTERLDTVFFDPADVRIVCFVNKTDLTTEDEAEWWKAEARRNQWPTFAGSATRDSGTGEAVAEVHRLLQDRESQRSQTLDTDEATRLANWDPFKPTEG